MFKEWLENEKLLSLELHLGSKAVNLKEFEMDICWIALWWDDVWCVLC